MGKYSKFLSKIIDSSEMACSLRFEDFKGCPYDTFTSEGIAALSLASSFLALLSLIVSA